MPTHPPSYVAVLRESKHSPCFWFGNWSTFLYYIALYCTVLCCSMPFCILRRDNNGINIIYSHMNQQLTTHWYYNSTYIFPSVGRRNSKYIQYNVFTRFCILGKGGAVWNLKLRKNECCICAYVTDLVDISCT